MPKKVRGGGDAQELVKVRGREKGQPPEPLAERTKPSSRHPGGCPRCQYWDLRGRKGTKPKFYQCPKVARLPARTCASHGAGSRKRIENGICRDPMLTRVETGEHCQPETLRYLFDRKPELRARYEHHLDSASLLDLRPQLATAKTLLDHFLQEADLNETMGPKGSDPPILRAVNAARTIVRLAGEMVAIEEKLGPLTHADVERLIHVFADCLNRFVPAEQRDAAIEWCQNEIRVARISALARTAKGEEPRDGEDGGGYP